MHLLKSISCSTNLFHDFCDGVSRVLKAVVGSAVRALAPASWIRSVDSRALSSLRCLLLGMGLICSAAALPAQENREPSSAEGDAQRKAEVARLQGELDQLVDTWRSILVEVGESGTKYYNGDFEESAQYKDVFEAAVAKGNAQKLKVRDKVLELFNVVESPDEELKKLVYLSMQDLANDGQMSRVYPLAHRMLEIDPDDEVMQVAVGFSSIATNRCAEASEFVKEHGPLVAKMGDRYQELYKALPELMSKMEKESAADARAAAEDDLPRVRLKTTKGDILVELFENEAPDTVGNFISLVESGFYTNIKFHRVIGQFMAQTGCPYGNGRGGPGYQIFDEHGSSNSRHHFSYRLSMANSGEPNTAGSQFFLTFLPQTHLDGEHTVFGRVIDGFDVVDRLTKTHTEAQGGEEEIEGAVPDEILSAEVVRKRDHEYKPNIAKEIER